MSKTTVTAPTAETYRQALAEVLRAGRRLRVAIRNALALPEDGFSLPDGERPNAFDAWPGMRADLEGFPWVLETFISGIEGGLDHEHERPTLSLVDPAVAAEEAGLSLVGQMGELRRAGQEVPEELMAKVKAFLRDFVGE